MGQVQKYYIAADLTNDIFSLNYSYIQSLQAYDQINVMTQGGPAGSTRTLLYMYYQSAFESFNVGEASSIAVVIILICVLYLGSILPAWQTSGALLMTMTLPNKKSKRMKRKELQNVSQPNFKISKLIRYLLLAMITLGTAFPFYWMVIRGFKTNDEIWQFPPTFAGDVPVEQLCGCLECGTISRYILNSTGVALAICLFQIVNSSMMAYALTHMKFRLKGVLTSLILVGYMIPSTAVYLPSYLVLGELNLLDSYTGLIVSNCVSVFSIFLIRQAFSCRSIS